MSDETVDKILEEGMKKSEEYKQKQEEPQEGFFKRWKQGILDMTVEQQLKSKQIGLVGGIFGLIIALIIMIYRKMWGFSVFIFFVIWLQCLSYIGTRQQLIATKEMFAGLETQKLGTKISEEMADLAKGKKDWKKQDIESPKIDKEIGNIKKKEI